MCQIETEMESAPYLICYGSKCDVTELVTFCKHHGNTLVVLLPKMRNYPPSVIVGIHELGDRMLVYECAAMGMLTVLRKRARTALTYFPGGVIVPETDFLEGE